MDSVEEVLNVFAVLVVFLRVPLEACKLFIRVSSYDLDVNKGLEAQYLSTYSFLPLGFS